MYICTSLSLSISISLSLCIYIYIYMYTYVCDTISTLSQPPDSSFSRPHRASERTAAPRPRRRFPASTRRKTKPTAPFAQGNATRASVSELGCLRLRFVEGLTCPNTPHSRPWWDRNALRQSLCSFFEETFVDFAALHVCVSLTSQLFTSADSLDA